MQLPLAVLLLGSIRADVGRREREGGGLGGGEKKLTPSIPHLPPLPNFENTTQAMGDAKKRASPACRGSFAYLVNFPSYIKFALDMVIRGTGIELKFEALAPGTDVRQHVELNNLVDWSSLPKAIGGDKVSVDEDGKVDETCSRGRGHVSLSAFLDQL